MGNFCFTTVKQHTLLFSKKSFEAVRNILQSPSEHGTAFVNSGDYQFALGLIGLQALFTTLFTLVHMSRISSAFSILDVYGLDESFSYKVPYVKIFFNTFIETSLLSCAFAGIILGISLLFKIRTTYKMMLCLAAIRSAVLIPAAIISTVLLFLNTALGTGLFSISSLAGICYMAFSFPAKTADTKRKIPAVIIISMLAFALASTLVLSKFSSGYLPSDLENLLS